MNNYFLENNYFDFLNFKSLKNESQSSLNEFCSFYLENYKGTTRDNLESLMLFFNKYLKDNHKDSIFLSIFQDNLKVCIYDSNIDFLKINDALDALNAFIKEFKEFLNS